MSKFQKVSAWALKKRGFTRKGKGFWGYMGHGMVQAVSPVLMFTIAFFGFSFLQDHGFVPIDFDSSITNPAISSPEEGAEESVVPTFENWKKQSREVCKGEIVAPSDKWSATHVVIVNLNMETKLMDIDQAWKRVESKTTDDDVWTVAICRKHATRA
jgi:hypothetical protein